MGDLHRMTAILIVWLASFWFAQATYASVHGHTPMEETDVILKALLDSSKLSKDTKTSLQADKSPNLLNPNCYGDDILAAIPASVIIDPASKSGRANATRGERIAGLVENLQTNAAIRQKRVIAYLKLKGVEYVSLWIENEIAVKKPGLQVLLDLASKFDEVRMIRRPGVMKIPKRIESAPSYPTSGADIPQPLQQIKARCSDIQCLGDGVVVAIIDTGVQWMHTELISNYRRTYGWYDPVEGTEYPGDKDGHGTHVAGLAVGKTKGVAPKAQWIACFGLPDGEEESELAVKLCGQWALCPHKWNNPNERDCSKAPHIITNSWSTIPLEQQTPRSFFYKTQMAWNAAGIISVFSAGNDSPYCTSVEAPAMYDISFAVGAVDSSSTAAWWSSRGPVLNMEFDSGSTRHSGTCKKQCQASFLADGTEICTLTKPDIVAPGVAINSSWIGSSNNAYQVRSGTGNSASLVAGVAALMLCANEHWPGSKTLDQRRTVSILKATASTDKINLAEGNGQTGQSEVNNYVKISNYLCNIAFEDRCLTFPNNLYGAEEVDACGAVKEVVRQAQLGFEETLPFHGWKDE